MVNANLLPELQAGSGGALAHGGFTRGWERRREFAGDEFAGDAGGIEHRQRVVGGGERQRTCVGQLQADVAVMPVAVGDGVAKPPQEAQPVGVRR